MITVGSGVHWFDIDRFLQEAYRLLKSKSWLVLYENHFISEMMGNESFKDWFPAVYLKKYPSPLRNDKYEWTNENLVKKNFNLVAEEKFKNPIVFNKRQLISYFTTQSNIISAVEKGVTTYEAAGQWLSDELSVFFGNEETGQTINYGNWIKYIQRVD
jgi:ubiquinone/menaquinone biosynthesis C-methylase UbiE